MKQILLSFTLFFNLQLFSQSFLPNTENFKNFLSTHYVNLFIQHPNSNSDLEDILIESEVFNYYYEYYIYARELKSQGKFDEQEFAKLERNYYNYLNFTFEVNIKTKRRVIIL